VAGNAALLGVLAFGSAEVAAGRLSVGDLSAFMLYSLFLGFQTAGLASTYADVQRAVGASERVLSLSERLPAMAPPSARDAAAAAAALAAALEASGGGGLSLAFQQCQFTYPARPEAGPVLRGLSLQLAAGEVVGLQGASGCGKSTLARLALRLYDADARDDGGGGGGSGGSSSASGVFVGGVDVRAIDLGQLRGGVIGVVAQDPFLLQVGA
jgi:ATP-binding cassette subfamily B protein